MENCHDPLENPPARLCPGLLVPVPVLGWSFVPVRSLKMTSMLVLKEFSLCQAVQVHKKKTAGSTQQESVTWQAFTRPLGGLRMRRIVAFSSIRVLQNLCNRQSEEVDKVVQFCPDTSVRAEEGLVLSKLLLWLYWLGSTDFRHANQIFCRPPMPRLREVVYLQSTANVLERLIRLFNHTHLCYCVHAVAFALILVHVECKRVCCILPFADSAKII